MPASTTTAFELLSPLLLSSISLALLCVWRIWNSPPAKTMGLSLAWFAGGLLVQVLWHPQAPPIPVGYVLAFSSCYLAACALGASTVAHRLQVTFPWRKAVIVSVLTLLAMAWFTLHTPNLAARVYIIKIMCLVVLCLPLLRWQSIQPINRFDHWMRWIYVAFLCSDLVHTLLQLPASLGGDETRFTTTWFWLGTHMFAISFGLAMSALLLFAITTDVMERVNHERLRDPLTQLLNRRGFEELSPHAKLPQPQQQWALLALDLDHFKQVNDHYGHAVGDQVLQSLATLLQQQVRAGDLVARFGGEEFVVLAAVPHSAAAEQLAQRIRTSVAQAQLLPHTAPQQSITISIGVAMMPGQLPLRTAQALLVADHQLYQAKFTGRNQVRMAPATYWR